MPKICKYRTADKCGFLESSMQQCSVFQTDVNLDGPDGNNSFPSGNGDLVMLVEVSAGTVDVSITLGYEAVT